MRNLVGKQRWDCVSNLVVLLCAVALKEIVVGKRLKPGGFPDGQTSALPGIGMYEVVPILRNVAGNSGAGHVRTLNPESVYELP